MQCLLLTCVYVVNSPVQSKYIHPLARACLSMKSWHAISEVVHDLCSINSANKLVEIVIPSLGDFFPTPLSLYAWKCSRNKVLFGNISSRQMDHKIRTKNHNYSQA